MAVFTVKALRELSVDQIVRIESAMTKHGNEFSKLLISMQADPDLGGHWPIAIAEKGGRIVSWARTEAWSHGEEDYSTIEACTATGHRRLGFASTCVRMLLALNATGLHDTIAVFSPEMRSLAAKVGFFNVSLFLRTDDGWERAV